MLSSGTRVTRADLARKLGVSRARVTQVLRLLDLAPEILETIALLGDPLPSPVVTERAPRSLVMLPCESQRNALRENPAGLDLLIPGLARRIIQRKAESTLNVQFRTRELQRCAQEERLAYRQWGHDVGRAYLRRIATIRNVSEFRKLFDIVSLHLHPLTGDRQGSYALTVTGRWRLIIAVEGDTAIIEEVSNHYGD